jgi:hypothetical protein
MLNKFIPNWKLKGLKSKEEARKRVLAFLLKDRKQILKRSFNDSFSVSFGDRMFVFNAKGVVSV